MMSTRNESGEINYAKIENRITERKNRLLMQTATILERLTNTYSNKVPYDMFEREYRAATNYDFQKKFEKLQKYMKRWDLADFFQDVPHSSVTYMLFEDHNGVKYIIVSNVVGKDEYVKKQKSRTSNMSALPGDERRNKWAIVQREAVMFSPPSWPFLSELMKERNQERYKNVVLRENVDVRECQELVYDWWFPQIKKCSQILFVLKKLSRSLASKPPERRFFLLTDMDETLLEFFPEEWLRKCPEPTINYNSFGLSKSKMIELNLIVRFDTENPNRFCVNELISHLNFELIEDEVASYIYDYADRHNSIYVSEIDLMLDANCKKWGKNLHHHVQDGRNLKEVRMEIIDKKIRMFQDRYFYMKGNLLTTRRNNQKFFVPLYFSPYNN